MKALFTLFMFLVSKYDDVALAAQKTKCESKLVLAKEEVNTIASKITELQKRLDTWTAKEEQIYPKAAVAFTAILTKSMTLGDGQVIKYDKMITNAGNAYNAYTGYFTVPFAGIYSLSVSMMGHPSNGIHLQLVRNGKELVRLWTGGSNSYELASQTINVELEKGEKVWVQRKTGTGSNIYGSELYNVFSAALLYQKFS